MLKREVLFPFGYGLSYTTFEFKNLNVQQNEEFLNITVEVTNTGDMEGSEVVQVYVSQLNPTVRRPLKELKDFAKVLVKPGQTVCVSLEIEVKYATSFWDEERNSWISEKDTYRVLVGNSSSATKFVTKDFNRSSTYYWTGI